MLVRTRFHDIKKYFSLIQLKDNAQFDMYVINEVVTGHVIRDSTH